MSAKAVPIFLGGDHSLSAGTIAGLMRRAAEEGRPLFVLWLDAHSDFHTPDTTESGNIHGMPVAYLTGRPGFGGVLPPLRHRLDPAQLCMIGLRSVDEAEKAALGTAGITVHDMRAIDEHGIVQGFYGMAFDITELHETQAQLERLARVDALTGLPNRRQFDERIEEALLRSKRLKQTIAVMFLDIDHFKQINDTFGHGGGDAVLCDFSRRLKSCVRATDSVARLAGDEFVVLLEGLEGVGELNALAAKVVGCTRSLFTVEGTELAVTASMGVATCATGQSSAAQVLARADEALYEAKRQGRNRYSIAAS